MRRERILDIIVVMLAVLFIYTGFSKLIDYDQFGSRLRVIPVFEHVWWYVSIGVPVSEVLIAGCLLIPRLRRIGLISSLIAMVIFTVYVIFILTVMKHPPCNCGGVIEKLTWKQHLYFNVAYTSVALVGLLIDLNIIRETERNRRKPVQGFL
jgi:uncharacterized membrane protein YphA (DoxX/SURF4 family)